jgi:Transposase DDE domain
MVILVTAGQRGADAACAHGGQHGQAAAGPTPDPPGRGRGRQGLQLPPPAALPAPPRHPGGDPEQVQPARQRGFDRAAYRERNRVERTINRLKQWRRVATRYGKREANYLAMVTIAAIVLLWLE